MVNLRAIASSASARVRASGGVRPGAEPTQGTARAAVPRVLLIGAGAAAAGGAAALGAVLLHRREEGARAAREAAEDVARHPGELNLVETGKRYVERFDADRSGTVDFPGEVRTTTQALFTMYADSGKPPEVEARRPRDGSRAYDYKATAWEFTEMLRPNDTDQDGWVSPAEGEHVISAMETLLAPAPAPTPQPASND